MNKKCSRVSSSVKFVLLPFRLLFLVSRALVIRITTYCSFQKNSFYPETTYMYERFCIHQNVQQILSQTAITDLYSRGFRFLQRCYRISQTMVRLFNALHSGILTVPLSKLKVNNANRNKCLFLIFCRYTTCCDKLSVRHSSVMLIRNFLGNVRILKCRGI